MSKQNINPSYAKSPSVVYSLEQCITSIQDDRKVLSYLLSKAESSKESDRSFLTSFLEEVESNASCRRIAITGSPGVGKSTFLDAYGSFLGGKGKKVAILPVDPTSNISKGSILGDKTRMEELISMDSVFVKPVASALALGGVAPATRMSIALCEKAGFDYVFIETVGVGQSEYAVRNMVDQFILLLQPGGGDELQGIKRGIMEMADVLIINKADGDQATLAKTSLKSYQSAIRLLLANDYDWQVRATDYSSLERNKTEGIHRLVDVFFQHMDQEERRQKLRRKQDLGAFKKATTRILLERIYKEEGLAEIIDGLSSRISDGGLSLFQAEASLRQTLDKG